MRMVNISNEKSMQSYTARCSRYKNKYTNLVCGKTAVGRNYNLPRDTLARYMSSTPDENDQIEKLKKAFTEQREYYENNLKEPYFERQKSCSHS